MAHDMREENSQKKKKKKKKPYEDKEIITLIKLSK